MHHTAFSLLPPFFILSAAYTVRKYIWQKWVLKSSDSEMPYASSDEEVQEKEEVSGDDDCDSGPGFSAPIRQAPGLHIV